MVWAVSLKRTMAMVSVFMFVMYILVVKVTHIRKSPLHPFKKSVQGQMLNSAGSLNHELKSVGRPGTITLSTPHTTEPFALTGSVEEEQDQSLSVPMIPEHDTMPFQTYLKSREELQKTEWVLTLHNFLQTLDKSVSPHVNLVFGDDDHRHLVLNWITAALMVLEPPLHNVMVLSLDHSLCDFLTTRKLPLPLTCITVPIESILISPNSDHADVRIRWSSRLMVRLPILRLINYWGYDVAAYDSDAVLLRNPQVVYTQRPNMDVFSAAGLFPFNVSKQWGFTLCAGAIMLRASPAVEALWSHVSAVPLRDEQKCLNWALVDMGVVWKETTSDSSICTVESEWECEGAINIFVFPQKQFCRGCCEPKMSRTKLYLVHPSSDKRNLQTKEYVLKKMQAWFLNKKYHW